MKRRPPQWPSVRTTVTLLISGTALLMNPCASEEVSAFSFRRLEDQATQEATQQSVVLPSFPPQEEDVTSAPSSADCGGCPPAPTDPPPPPPTANPSSWPTVAPTANPTMWPTLATTPSPTTTPSTETETSTPETPAPVTPEPSTAVTSASTDTPTTMPTGFPTITPTVSTLAPTSSATTNIPQTPALPVLTTPPTSPVVTTSLEPFIFTLYISEAQAAVGSEDPEAIATEVESILSDFLFGKLSEFDFGDGVTLNNVNLNVTPQIRRALRDSIVFAGSMRRLRSLQVQTLNFDVTGTATFEVAQGSDVTEQNLTKEVNAATKDTLENPYNQEELVREFEASDSEVLSLTVGVSAQLQEPNESSFSSKPSAVSLIFGFVIVGLGAVGLAIYGYAFIKKRRKRALQRKRERDGQYEGYSAAVNTTQSTLSANRSLPSSASKVMVLPPTNEDESSASSSASYEGVASESSGSQSDFTRELQLAASLDRRAWIDVEKQREAMNRDGRGFGYSMPYPSQYTTTSAEDEGVEVRNVSAGGEQALNIASFPYGDEQDDDDSDSVALSEVKGRDGEDLFSESEEGVEWTAEGVWDPYGYSKQKNRSAVEESGSSIDRAPESRDHKQRDSNAYMKSWSSIDTVPENRQRKQRDSNAYMKSWSSIDTAPQNRARRNSSNPFEEDPETDGVSRSAPETSRMSPTGSSAGTSNAVRMSPTTSGATDVAAKQIGEPSQIEAEEVSKEADSLLTADIVKEVHRLARFVKRYERKREKKEQKELEQNEQVTSTNEVRSVPSVGYDALSDSISALQKGPPEASPRREKMALSNAVEESDETEASLTTERSWSTESRANSGFEDEDEELPVDESEVDSSIFENISDAASDESRLGITPFKLQKLVVPQPTTQAPSPSPPETSRPPVTGQERNAKGLSPIPGTPGSPDDVSPEKTHTPVQNIKRVMRRVNSARLKKSAEKTPQVRTPAKRPRESDLTEEALQEMSAEGGTPGVPSPYQQHKGALQSLRKNDAILDTASSIVTDGVTPSQHDHAFQVVEGAPQAQPYQISQRFQAKAYRKMQQRAPRDPPTQRTPTQPTEGRSQPTQHTPPQQDAVVMHSPPVQRTLPQDSAESVAPPVASEMHSSPVQYIPPLKAPGSAQPTTPKIATESRSPFISPFAKPTTPKSTQSTTVKGTTETRNPPAEHAAALEGQGAAKRAALPTTMRSPFAQNAPQLKAQETAPPTSPEMRSPPRRKSKKSAAFNSIVNMFESKPKEAIFPPNESWQYNC